MKTENTQTTYAKLEKEREKNKYRKTNYGHTILIVFVSVGSWLDDS